MFKVVTDAIIHAVSVVPPWLATIIISALPLTEMRASIPVALLGYHLPVITTFFLAVIGSMLPVYFLLVFFEALSNWLRRTFPIMDRFLGWLYAHTQQNHSAKIEKYGVWALVVIAAVPAPLFGAWSGSLVAFVFGIPKKQAFWAIGAGVAVASLLVIILTLGASASYQAITH
jgi:uncharacterized membrane protein